MTDKKETFIEAWEKLVDEAKLSKPIPNKGNKYLVLPIEKIKKNELIFQPRLLEEDEARESGDHVRNLVTALVANSEKKLDPILVWWSGKEWKLIDGHHRMKAYRAALKEKRIKSNLIPVEVFEGSLEEAWVESIRSNAKNKLPVSQDDKFNRAWRMVVMNIGSKSTQSASCAVGERTIANMRVRLKELKSKFGKHWQDVALSRTWKEILTDLTPPVEINEAWEDRLAREWADRLGEEFGSKFAKQPDIAAKALEIYSENLVKSLKELWSDKEYDF